MNILLTSVGRRAYMVRYFQDALQGNGEVHVCNSDDKSIAFKYADKTVVSPLIYDGDYIPFLLDYCQKNDIAAVISLFDIDLLMLAQHKEEFEKAGIKLIVSDPEIVAVCNDKWKTYQFLTEKGFHAPVTFLKLEKVLEKIHEGELAYPVIVKPRYGCGSIGISVAYDEEDLIYLTKKVNKEIEKSYLKYESSVTEEKVIYQECLGGQEYGADIINDLNGKTVSVIIRKKLAMRSGETDIAELVDEPVIRETLEKLGAETGHIANMDCDIFLVNGIPYILEMNARFGGGYPFSHMGGCNLPRAIVDWVEGKETDKKQLTARTGVTGFKEIYIVER